ncbi:MAG: hypothetical protein MZW92_03570 [Comamonadaceae bacterium]|nr:hypothetical protein [Comamonadaceae bacterium]
MTVTVLRLYFAMMPVSWRATLGLKGHLFADAEVEHVRMSAHLMQELQPRDDAVVQIDEFGFSQLVDVDRHGGGSPER